MHYFDEYNRWRNYTGLTAAEQEEMEQLASNEEAVKARFGSTLSFGTAGLRGIRGLGTNRMNRYTVRRASQGLASYLNKKFFYPSVVISYDSRLDSRVFAEETAHVLVANGIRVHMFGQMMPVAVLSYAILKLQCSAGVMITASHNPKEYNGYKVYNEYGGQILDEEANAILGEIEAVDIFQDIKISHEKTNMQLIGRELYEEYLKEVARNNSFTPERDLKIVYTPLNGTGMIPVKDILSQSGFNFFVVPEQELEDGNFPTCPSPNPEKEEVYTLAKKYGIQQNADILLATDPDCDRVGVMVKHEETYRLLSGNEIGILLLQYICETEKNLLFKAIYTSLVSTPAVDCIAEKYGVKVKRTPVGFKYIGKLIGRNPENFLFAFEESNGYLTGSYARDKDGVAGVYAIVQMAAYYKAKGKNLIEVLEDIHQTYGYTIDKTISMDIKDMFQVQRIMDLLRRKEQVSVAFAGLSCYIDYEADLNNPLRTRMNVVHLEFEDACRIIVRPSGTEPKIKFYYSAVGVSRESAEKKLKHLMEVMKCYLQLFITKDEDYAR